MLEILSNYSEFKTHFLKHCFICDESNTIVSFFSDKENKDLFKISQFAATDRRIYFSLYRSVNKILRYEETFNNLEEVYKFIKSVF